MFGRRTKALNLNQPVNRSAALNDGLVAWLKVVTQGPYFGGARLLDLCGLYHGTLAGGAVWTGHSYTGGRGSLALDDASAQYADIAAAVVGAMPLTLMCWFRSDAADIDQVLVSISDSTNATNLEGWWLEASGTVANDPLRARTSAGAGSLRQSVAAGYTVGKWHHAAGVFATTTSRTAYLDGIVGVENTQSVGVVNQDITTIGRIASGGTPLYLSGNVDDVRIYNRALSADEVAAVYLESLAGNPTTLNYIQRATVFDVGGGAPAGGARARYMPLLGAA